ncbi:dynein regulatory complex protein 10-like [Asterias amurensis]|uniref:dynein regulatory complex protein 10-like n=1 Tax=Asterias amurensis TaxID=7602 RepID=UPI003AB49CC7
MASRRSMGDVSGLESDLNNVDAVELDNSEVSFEPPQESHFKTSKEAKHPGKVAAGHGIDLGRKKLTTVESQRVLAVLDESIQRLEVATLLPYLTENLDRYSDVFGTELLTALDGHSHLNKSYTHVYNRLNPKSRASSRFKSSSVSLTGSISSASRLSSIHVSDTYEDRVEIHSAEDEEQLKEYLSVLKKKLSFATRNILRLLSLNPPAVRVIKARWQDRRDDQSNNLIKNMKELRGFMLTRLLTTPLEEKDELDYLSLIDVRERKNAQIIKKLSAELGAAQDFKDTEISRQNEEIRRLKSDLNQIEKLNDDFIRRTKTEAEKQQQVDTKNWAGKQDKLTADLQSLKAQLSASITDHREKELTLRKRKFKIETELENWILKYDTDVGDRQLEFEDADAIYTEEKARLNEIEERFTTLEAEYLLIIEEHDTARKIKEIKLLEFARHDAATKFQRLWKDYRRRKAQALKAKKKKGKKKGADKKK